MDLEHFIHIIIYDLIVSEWVCGWLPVHPIAPEMVRDSAVAQLSHFQLDVSTFCINRELKFCRFQPGRTLINFSSAQVYCQSLRNFSEEMRKIGISRQLTGSDCLSVFITINIPTDASLSTSNSTIRLHPSQQHMHIEIQFWNDDYKMYLRLVSLARSFASPLHFGKRKTELLIRNEQRNSFNWSSDFPFVLFSCTRCPWIYLNVFLESFALHACFTNILELNGHKKWPKHQIKCKRVSFQMSHNSYAGTVRIINSTHCNCGAHDCFAIQRNNFIWNVFLFGQGYCKVIVGLSIANHRNDVIHAVLISWLHFVYVWMVRSQGDVRKRRRGIIEILLSIPIIALPIWIQIFFVGQFRHVGSVFSGRRRKRRGIFVGTDIRHKWFFLSVFVSHLIRNSNSIHALMPSSPPSLSPPSTTTLFILAKTPLA